MIPLPILFGHMIGECIGSFGTTYTHPRIGDRCQSLSSEKGPCVK